jgi:hypothetical protein
MLELGSQLLLSGGSGAIHVYADEWRPDTQPRQAPVAAALGKELPDLAFR